jgi:hypothetical protein
MSLRRRIYLLMSEMTQLNSRRTRRIITAGASESKASENTLRNNETPFSHPKPLACIAFPSE